MAAGIWRLWLRVAAVVAAAAAVVVALPSIQQQFALAGACADAAVSVTSLNPPVFYADLGNSPSLSSGYAGYAITTTTSRPDVWVGLSGFTSTGTSVIGLASSQPAALPLASLAANSTTPAFFLLTASATSSAAQSHTVTVYQGKPGTSAATVLCTTTGSFASVQSTQFAQANKLQATYGDTTAVRVSTSSPQLGGSIAVTVDGVTGQIGSGLSVDPSAFYMTPSAASNWPAGAFRLVHTSLKMTPSSGGTTTTYPDVLHLGNLPSGPFDYQAVYTFAITGSTSGATSAVPVQEIASGNVVKHTDTSNYATLIPPISAPSNPLRVGLSSSTTALPSTGGAVTFTQTLTSTSATPSSIDGFAVTVPIGATVVAGSTTLNGSAVGDPATTGTGYIFDGPFTTSSAAPQTLTYQVLLPGSPGSYPVSGYGVLADNDIGTTSATDGSALASVTVNVAAPPVAQSITFPALSDTALDAAAPALAATASSGLPVSYSTSTPSVCTVAGTALTMHAVGTCTVAADQSGNDSHLPATQVTRTFAVTIGSQTITFPSLPDTSIYGTAPTPAATASSDLPISYASATTDVCTVNGTNVTLLSVGTCSLTASQAGDGINWNPAADVTRTFGVLDREPQNVTFPPLADITYGDAAPTLAATSSAGLPVTYGTTTPSVCSVSGATLTAFAVGTCAVTADQPGTSSYLPAAQQIQSFTVGPVSQTITFPAPSDVTYGVQPLMLTATSSAGLAVGYTGSSDDVCTVTGSAVTVVGAGACIITAVQTGSADGTIAAATPVTRTFTVNPADQTITVDTTSDLLVGETEVLNASADSGLPVDFTTSTVDVCTISAGRLSAQRIGVCTITAHQGGNGDYTAAADVTASIDIAGMPQTLNFAAPGGATFGAPAPTLTASASSGLPVSYVSDTPATCIVDTLGLTLLAPGTCTLTATQPGDGTTWAAAPPVTTSLTVLPAPEPAGLSQTITFSAPATSDSGSISATLTATASSGLPITYVSSTPAICSVTGNTLSVVADGTCTLTATQPGDDAVPAATPVTVSLPVHIPTLPATTASTTTVAVNPGTATLTGLPPGAVVSVPAGVVGTVPGIASISVSGTTISVSATRGFSGIITVPVTVEDGAARATTHVLVVVSPAPASVARIQPGARTTGISWAPSPNATGYTVRADGRVICTTATTHCVVKRLLGPGDHVTITATGNDRTSSTPTYAAVRISSRINVGIVYFGTDSARLTPADRALLRRVAATLVRTGLRHLELSGYTDHIGGYRYNLALSDRRAHAVARYLQHRLPRTRLRYALHHYAYLDPAAPNTSSRGRALNRRTSIAID